ncbi:MAG: hypothetical protein ACK4HV_05720, partial [Parachlamydiaceae bacterium]
GGSGPQVPFNPYSPETAKLPVSPSSAQAAADSVDALDQDALEAHNKAGVYPNGKVAYVDSAGDHYTLNEGKPSPFNKEYHDTLGTYYKNENGIKFTQSNNTMNTFISDSAKGRSYDNGNLNAYGDVPQQDEYGRLCFRDNTNEIYYLDKDFGRIFYDKNGQEYFKDVFETRYFRNEEAGKTSLVSFEFNEAYERVPNDVKPFLSEKVLHNMKTIAKNVEEPAKAGIDGANAPSPNPKNLKSLKANDITDEVKKKIQEYNQDEELVAHINDLKEHEHSVDRVNVVIGIGVGLLAVAAIVATVASFGIAGGIIGAIAAGAMSVHQGVHAGTRAPENQSREANKAKLRMEDIIESDKEFLRNLKADDEKKGIKRNFSLLSPSVKIKAEDAYDSVELSSQVDSMLYDFSEYTNMPLGDKDNWNPNLDEDPKTAKKAKKEKDDTWNDTVDDEIYNL